MPHWLSMSNFSMIGLFVVVIAVILGATWFRPTAGTVGGRVWWTGVAAPLGLISITLGRWGISRHWDFAPALIAIVLGTGVWVGYVVSHDAAIIRWGSRSDLLGRAGIAVIGACMAVLGVIEAHKRYGSVNVVRQWYVIAIVLLLVAVVLKPAWVRALYRTPQPTQR
jgi:hypothetical protein